MKLDVVFSVLARMAGLVCFAISVGCQNSPVSEDKLVSQDKPPPEDKKPSEPLLADTDKSLSEALKLPDPSRGTSYNPGALILPANQFPRGYKGPRIAIGKVTASGKYDWHIVRRVARRHLKHIRSCFETRLSNKLGQSGTVVLGFTIASDGKVLNAKVFESPLNSESTEECVEKAVQTWIFPKPKAGDPVTASFSLEFTLPSE